MDKILQNHDFSGIDPENIKDIKETCMIFQNMSFAPDSKDWKWICIKGTMVGKPIYDYYIHKMKGGFSVQVMKAGDSVVYHFAVVIFTEDGVLKIWPYNNGHLS